MAKAVEHNGDLYDATVNNGADFFAQNLKPKESISAVRITLMIDTAAVVNMVLKKSGKARVVGALNDGDAIKANVYRTFTWSIHDGIQGYNFTHGDAGPIKVLYMSIDEVLGGVI